MSTPFFFGAAGDDIVDRILRHKAAEAQAGRDLVQAIQAPAPTPTPTPAPMMAAAAPVMPTPLPPVMPTPGPMMAAPTPTPTPTPMPKPAAPAPTQVQPLRDSQFEDVRSGSSMNRKPGPAPAAPPPRRAPIRVVRGGGQGGTDLYTNIGTAGDVVVDNGVSVGPDVGTKGRGGTVEFAHGPRYVSDAVLENGARQAAQLDTERLIERLQAGPGVGAAPATAGEQLEDQRRVSGVNNLTADRDEALGMLEAQYAAGLSPDVYLARKQEIMRAWAMDASANGARIDPRFFSAPAY